MFHFDDLKIEIIDDISLARPNIHYSFTCYKCRTSIYRKTVSLREEKNYFEVLARLFKEMEHTRIKARLNYTRQATIKESVNDGM